MIICLSGFVIAGTGEAGAAAERLGVGVGCERAAGVGGRYSPHHQQLLQQLGGARSASSSVESVLGLGAVGTVGTACRVRTLYACLGEGEGELSFEPNQIITSVAPSGEPGWLTGTLNGRTGLVPENYVEPLP